MNKTWTSGRKVYEATHTLIKEEKGRPIGTSVYLLVSRKEADGQWSCLVCCPVLSKAANSYQFVCAFSSLKRV